MPALIIYSLKFSVCLGVIYLFYYLILRNLTFYNWNRYYLLIGTGLSFLIPLVNMLPILDNEQTNSLKTISGAIPTFVKLSSPVLDGGNTPNYTDKYLFLFISIIFGIGVLLQAGRLIVQFVSFFRIRRAATRLQDQAIKIYQVDEKIAPFSFGNAIYLNKNLLQPVELQEIIRHEQVHIMQKHTLDVLWLEFLCLVNWYNPFAWLLKAAVRQNLEFVVDQAVLVDMGTDKKYYQYLLLKVIGLPNLKIANQFNISSLKTRITMMNKMPSNRWEIVKFLFVLPLMAILLLACQDNADTAFKDLSNAKDASIQNVLPPPPPPVVEPPLPPPPPPALREFRILFSSDNLPADHQSFLKRHLQVKAIGWDQDGAILIVPKSNPEQGEIYELNNPVSRAMAEKKYGELPKHPRANEVTQFTPPIIEKNK